MPFDTTQILLNPPADWFTPPESGIPLDRRVTIEASGRVYGYIALWNACHVGMEGCVSPPKGSPSDYALAHHGETMTAEGDLIATANIGGGAGHYDGNGDPVAAVEHYDNTNTQLMRVKYGEDEQGLWFAGSLWPDVSELDVERIRATALSGDWRWVSGYRTTTSGAYDFTGAVLVNIPGFPLEANGGVSTRDGFMQDIAASMKADVAICEIDNAIDNQSTEVSMTDCTCKETTAAIVEPLDPEGVATVIEEIIAKHAIASVEELLSILRPKAEGDDVTTNTVEEDTPMDMPVGDSADVGVTAAILAASKYDKLQSSIQNLTDMMADYISLQKASNA